MRKYNNILTTLFCCLILISCGQTETKSGVDENTTNKQFEKKYTKVISDSTNILTDRVENLELEYPQGTIGMEEPMLKAKAFRYTKLEVIDNPNFKADSKVETLTLRYNAVSCICAQWSETRKTENTDRKQNYWLEPANEKLVNSDKLFNGENLPIIIKVSGQVITENGFPKRELAKVGKDEAGKVFRYTKIEILQSGQKKNVR